MPQRLDSPDALVDFFGGVGATLSRNPGLLAGGLGGLADSHSVLGTALRRAFLAFDMLPFEVDSGVGVRPAYLCQGVSVKGSSACSARLPRL